MEILQFLPPLKFSGENPGRGIRTANILSYSHTNLREKLQVRHWPHL